MISARKHLSTPSCHRQFEFLRVFATIAEDVGYESEAAFSRAFKKLVGAPPAAWRRQRRATTRAT